MRKSALTLVAVGAAAALAVSGCSSSSKSKSDSSTTSGGSGGKNTINAACKLTDPPKSQAKVPAASSNTTKASGKVGVILPDTTSSTRYTLYDQPLLQSALSAAGITPDIQNAGGSTAKFAQIAQAMIGEGVKVLIIDSIDQQSGAGVEAQAKAAGVKVIDYDRVNLGGSADYYVSFDNEDVGKLQGEGLVACLDATKAVDPTIIQMDGGTDVDNNAVLFKSGAESVLKPLQSQGKLKITADAVVKGWTVSNAAPAFTQSLQSVGGSVDGVLAANDDIANAVIGVLKNSGLNGHVVISGQDSGVEGLQNIINGQQSFTIFKNVKLEAQAAAQLAIALIAGQDPSAAGITLSKFDDPTAPSHNIQALLLPSQIITQANIKDVVDSGLLTAADICKGVEDKCKTLGVS